MSAVQAGQEVEFNAENKDSGMAWKSKISFSNSKELGAPCTDVLTLLEEIFSYNTNFQRILFLKGI